MFGYVVFVVVDFVSRKLFPFRSTCSILHVRFVFCLLIQQKKSLIILGNIQMFLFMGNNNHCPTARSVVIKRGNLMVSNHKCGIITSVSIMK